MKKGGFMKDALILSATTLILGICLDGVYEITKLPIQESEMKADLATYQEVYPSAVDFKFGQALQDAVETAPENFASAGLNIGGVGILMALNAVDASGNVVGHIFIGLSKDGYSGNIKVSVGATNEGEITSIGFAEINEIPGFGMNAANPGFKDRSRGKTAEQLNLVKGGDVGDDGIDAMSDATVTLTAVANTVNGVPYFAHNCVPQ